VRCLGLISFRRARMGEETEIALRSGNAENVGTGQSEQGIPYYTLSVAVLLDKNTPLHKMQSLGSLLPQLVDRTVQHADASLRRLAT